MRIDLQKISQAKAIAQAIKVLRAGGIVIYPTETCYGLGVDATNPAAVDKLWQYKGQRGNKAVSVAVADQAMAEQYVVINSIARNLYQNFLPGPITVISQSRAKVIKKLQAGKKTLGIRLSSYPLVSKIVRRLGKPMTATSANTSGKKAVYSFPDWQKYTSQKKQALVDLFLDAGVLPQRLPSTVVDTTLNEARVLRQGKIKLVKAQSSVTQSALETQQLAQQIFRQVQAEPAEAQVLILALQGELGAGKTQFAKGVAQALGIKQPVVSPTFNLVREYEIRTGKLFHLDTWRLEKAEDIWGLGFKAMLQPGNVIVIEWLEKVKSILDDLKNVNIVWLDIESLALTKRRIKWLLV